MNQEYKQNERNKEDGEFQKGKCCRRAKSRPPPSRKTTEHQAHKAGGTQGSLSQKVWLNSQEAGGMRWGRHLLPPPPRKMKDNWKAKSCTRKSGANTIKKWHAVILATDGMVKKAPWCPRDTILTAEVSAPLLPKTQSIRQGMSISLGPLPPGGRSEDWAEWDREERKTNRSRDTEPISPGSNPESTPLGTVHKLSTLGKKWDYYLLASPTPQLNKGCPGGLAFPEVSMQQNGSAGVFPDAAAAKSQGRKWETRCTTSNCIFCVHVILCDNDYVNERHK